MNNIVRFLSIFLLVCITGALSAQVSPKDSIVSGFMIDIHYSFHIPGGDMTERFGLNSAAGPAIRYKTKNNYIFELDGSYIFGNDVKIQDSILKDISTDEGWVIDGDGLYAEIFTFERGFTTSAKIGKLFPVWGPNDNCGIFFMLGGGYMQHKIRIYNQDMTAPQVKDDYKKGYDRLTGGFSASQQIGYFFIGNRKSYSFTASFEIIEGFTKPLRNYQYDLMGPEDDATRLDLLYGIRLSWMIPLFKQPSDGYYYD